jgi:cytochrome c oxidase cbb3-type subunit 3
MNRRTAVAILLFAAIPFVSCEREERGFRVQTPDANRVNSKQLTTLQAGEPSPLPSVQNQYEENAYALSEGKRLFSQMNCSGCHAHGGGGIGPALMDDKWIYGSQPEQIFSTIEEGRPNGMPSFHGKLPDYQVWELAAYVRSLSGLTSKDAAPGRNDDMQSRQPENSTEPKQPKRVTPPTLR